MCKSINLAEDGHRVTGACCSYWIRSITWELGEFAEAEVIPDFESVAMWCCRFMPPDLPTTWVRPSDLRSDLPKLLVRLSQGTAESIPLNIWFDTGCPRPPGWWLSPNWPPPREERERFGPVWPEFTPCIQHPSLWLTDEMKSTYQLLFSINTWFKWYNNFHWQWTVSHDSL